MKRSCMILFVQEYRKYYSEKSYRDNQKVKEHTSITKFTLLQLKHGNKSVQNYICWIILVLFLNTLQAINYEASIWKSDFKSNLLNTVHVVVWCTFFMVFGFPNFIIILLNEIDGPLDVLESISWCVELIKEITKWPN